MTFFDTRLRKLIEFVPKHKEVTIYVCGITPYDSAHLGHIFTFMTYDLLRRRLEDKGYTVRLVRNITDIDEPIFEKAAENNEHYMELAKREVSSFQTTMRTLNFRQPEAEPLASEYVNEMAAAVQTLLDRGHAYTLENDIYFDVSTFNDFGSFSGFSPKLLRAFMAERGGDPERPGKRRPLDFLLWRGITDPNDLAAWDTPVGHGRPGWHIECSVMSSHLLGTPIDIHGGGMDLIFPHHECEIAQSESITEQPLANHWLHVAPMIRYGEKMSKSLGNLVFARDLLDDGSPMAVRLAVMRYHYRVGGEWRDEWWKDAKTLDKAIRSLLGSADSNKHTGLLEQIRHSLDDDLHTPAILMTIKTHVVKKGSNGELRDALSLLGLTP